MQKINVKQKEGAEEVPAEVIAQSIVEIAQAFKRIEGSRLTRRAIVTLIQAQSKVGKTEIELVLNNLLELERLWLKPSKS